MSKNLPIPLKITNQTNQTTSFQTSHSWAVLLGASYNPPQRTYFLPNNTLNQTKLKKLLPDYNPPPPSPSPPSPSLRDYQQKDLNFLAPLTKIGIFSEMRTGKTPLALHLFQKWPISNLLIIVPAILQSQWQKAVVEWIHKPALVITYLEKKQRIYFYQKLITDEEWILIVSKDTFKLDKDYWEKQKTKKKLRLAVIVDEGPFLTQLSIQSKQKFIYSQKHPL